MPTPGIVQLAIDNKEVISIVVSAIGVLKTAFDVIQSRSRESTRDKLLLRIQGLVAANQAMILTNSAGPQQFPEAGVAIYSQLSDALTKFAGASEAVREKNILEGGKGLLRRVFLLYKPIGVRAWVSHLICWSSALLMFLGFFGTWFSDEGDISWSAFVQSWENSDIYFARLFLLGIFLLARLWGVAERKRSLQKEGELPRTKQTAWFATVATVVYVAFGAACLIAAIAYSRENMRAAIKFGAFGLVLMGCGLTLHIGGRPTTTKNHMSVKHPALLLIPPLLLMLIVLFDIDGIIESQFRDDPLGYWRSWIQQPWIPIVFISFSAVPLYAGIRHFRAVARPPWRTESASLAERETK